MNFEVLKLRDFRVTLLTRFLIMTSWIAQDVIIGWQVYSITKDPFMLGLVGLTEFVPAVICALFAGYIVDISRPFRILVTSLGVMMANSTVLMLLAGGHLHPGGLSVLPWLFIGVFISGVARAFIMPSAFSMLPQIVPRNLLSAAAAFLTSSIQMATVLAPAITGLVYGGYGATAAWYIPMSLTIIAFFVYAFGISPVPRQWRSTEVREKAAKSIKAGWSFILNNKIVLTVMSLDMFAVIFGGALAMLPAYADQVLHVGSEGLGLLRAAPAIGAIVTALLLATRPFSVIKAKWLLWVVFGFGLCTIGLGLSHSFWFSMLCLILSGCFDSVSMVFRQTMMQWLTPDNMRGRVSSVNSMFIISSNQFGAFSQGTLAKLMGLVPAIIFGGMGTIAVVGLIAGCSSKFRRFALQQQK